jgi:hypothetical protein
MSLFGSLFARKRRASNALLGCWHLIPDSQSDEAAEADFRDDGTLHYSVLSGTRWRIMKLTYRIDGDVIVSNQPSAPAEQRSRFSVALDGTLTLEFGGVQSRFRRGEKRAPRV